MPRALFQFGEMRPEYQIPVLNERAVRAAAGILFFLALTASMNAWLSGNFQPTRVFVVGFLIEFSIRIFVNPRFAPILMVGQWVVRRQQPEWSGAPQKRFAWAIGLAFAVVVAGIAQWVYSHTPARAIGMRAPLATLPAAPLDAAEAERCKVPGFAKAMGHEEKWKLHNNCQ